MSKQRCPNCNSTETFVESRRRHPKGATTVGSWRIPYGIFFGGIALIFGLTAFFLGQSTNDVFMGQVATLVSSISLVMAAFILGSAFYITRWTETEELHCDACEHRWTHEEDVLSSTAK